jgi:DNA-binding MarR family transcriptional regulator
MESYGEHMELRDSIDFCTVDITSHYPQIDSAVEGATSRISAIGKHLARTFDDTVADYGLNHGEYRLLLRLSTRAADHRMSAGDLSKMLALSSGAMTNRLDRLERAGLVRRVPDPRDRRGVLVELTEAGKERIDAAVIDQAAKEIDSLRALSAKELTTLNHLLRKVLASLEDPAASSADPAPVGR